MDPDDIEYTVNGLLSKKIQIQKESFIETVKICSCASARHYLVTKEPSEQTLSSMLDIFFAVISGSPSSSSAKHVRFYALICLVVLVKDPEVRRCKVDLGKVVLCVVDFLAKAAKEAKFVCDEKEAALCISSVRDNIEKLFQGEHTDDAPYSSAFDALQWLTLLNEVDCSVLILSDLVCHSVIDKAEEKTRKKLQAIYIANSGRAFSVLLESLAAELMQWMSEEQPISLWRLGNLFQLFSKCIAHYDEGKEVLCKLATKNGNFKEMFNTVKACNDKLVNQTSALRQKEAITYCLLSGARLLVDLTHKCQTACDVIGAYELELLLDMLVFHSKNEPCKQEKSGHEHSWQFDFCLILLSILSNCTERTQKNRKRLGGLKGGTGCEHVVDVFVRTLPSDVVKALKTAAISEEIEFGWDAEQLVLSSYATLLLGCLMRESDINRMRILKHIPGHSPVILIHILRASVAFQKDANVLTDEALEATSEIMEELEAMLTKTGNAKKSKENRIKPSTSTSPSAQPAKRQEKPSETPTTKKDEPVKQSPKKKRRGMISLDDIF